MGEDRFSNAEAMEPELMAHHYAEPKLSEREIPLWQKAGTWRSAVWPLPRRLGIRTKGLKFVAAPLPRIAAAWSWMCAPCWLGTASIALKVAVQEVWDSLHPALERGLPWSRHRVR